jgi:hypothetical protein
VLFKDPKQLLWYPRWRWAHGTAVWRQASKQASKQPRSARGAAAVLACGPTKKSGKVRRAAKHASPAKRLYGGKATTSVGLASSLDRNCKRTPVCTNLFGLTYPLVYVLKCQATGPPAHREGSAQRSPPLHNAPMTGRRAATQHC